MAFIDPHIHMVSRTTDDYEKMATAGCIAVSEPAFWAGFDRGSPRAFEDYFRQLTVMEPKRAAQYGIRHYTWISMNPKESENISLAREVMSIIPNYLHNNNVIGIGEIGLNRVTRNELQVFEEQLDMALKNRQLIMVHTPHLEDKLKGTRLLIDALKNRSEINPKRVLIDHVEEHTYRWVLDQGYWAGMTLYPYSKISIPRAADVVELCNGKQLMVNSGGDWGPSDPLAVPRLALELRLRGHAPEIIDQVTLTNASSFMAQSPKFSPAQAAL